jgi:hypothetical protein
MFPRLVKYKVKAHRLTILAICWIPVDITFVGATYILEIDGNLLKLTTLLALFLHAVIVGLMVYFWVTEEPKEKLRMMYLSRRGDKLY